MSYVVCIVPSSFPIARTETKPIYSMLVCDSYDIFEALLLSRILAGPVGPGVEGERVEVAEDWYMISKYRCRGGQPPDPGVGRLCKSHKGPPSQQQLE